MNRTDSGLYVDVWQPHIMFMLLTPAPIILLTCLEGLLENYAGFPAVLHFTIGWDATSAG